MKLFNTSQFTKLHHASAPRLGLAAITCALISVLAVECTRLSITAIAAPAPQQAGAKHKPAISAVRSTTFEKASRLPSARTVRVASAGSVHFPTTPAVISELKDAPTTLAGSLDETVISLPAPAPQASAEGTETVTKPAAGPRRQTGDKLLGSISAKGKFLARRSSSKWSGTGQPDKRRVAAPGRRNFLEKLFNPVINSANAKAPSRRIRPESDDLSELSR